MMIRISGTVLLAGALLAGASWAQEADCRNPQNQMEMNFCAEQDWISQDARLNAEYKSAMARAKEFDANGYTSGETAAAALKTAQRAWIPFRDGNCAAVAFEMKGGTGEPLMYYGCMAAMTATRADELAAWLAFY